MCCGMPEVMADLVQDVAFMDGNGKDGSVCQPRLAVGFAHNRVQVWDWNAGSCLHDVQCIDPCILYSMALQVEAQRVVVFAGTVYNQVLVWTADVTTDDKQVVVPTSDAQPSVRPILQKLCGHEGVLFKIRILPAARVVATVSDDRSVRLWRLRPENCAVEYRYATSFVNDILCTADEANCTGFYQEWAGWGHQARIWDVDFVGKCENLSSSIASIPAHLRVVTVGEDSQGLVWNMRGECVAKFIGHTGRHVWSVAVDSHTSTIATGGGDSNVKLWRIQVKNLHGCSNGVFTFFFLVRCL